MLSASFAGPVNFPVGTFPSAVTSGDFNADSYVDLATSNNNTGDVSVLLGDGLGGFATTNYAAGNLARAVTVGDFNNDGFSDLVVANHEFGANPDYLSVLL